MTAASPEQVVLVVAGQDDLFSDKVILDIDRQGGNVVRLDLGATPLHVECALSDGRWRGAIQAGDGKPVHFDKVRSVLWRWGGEIPGNPEIEDPDQRAWAAEEDTEAALGVLRSLPAYWMSHPDRLATVEGAKPVQLRDAVLAGLPIPDSLITTEGTAAREWTSGGAHIYKAFRSPYRPRTGAPGWVLASRVCGPIPDDLCAASTFQQLIEGTPVRVTVIGEHVFAVEVAGIRYDVDWRPQQTDADLRPVPVPDRIRQAICALMNRWGLTYGALDFIANPAGEWVFLEVNPCGAYGFVEEATGLPLTATIAETLLRGGMECPH